jgi:hypothetical protein
VALMRVAGIKAGTPRGVAENALFLQDCAGSLAALTLALSLGEDVVAFVNEMLPAADRTVTFA